LLLHLCQCGAAIAARAGLLLLEQPMHLAERGDLPGEVLVCT